MGKHNKMISLDEQTLELAQAKHGLADGFSGWVRTQLLKERQIEFRIRAQKGENVEHLAWRRTMDICWPFHPEGVCVICWPDGPPDSTDWMQWAREETVIVGDEFDFRVEWKSPPPQGLGWLENDEMGDIPELVSGNTPQSERKYVRRFLRWLWSWI